MYCKICNHGININSPYNLQQRSNARTTPTTRTHARTHDLHVPERERMSAAVITVMDEEQLRLTRITNLTNYSEMFLYNSYYDN